MFCAAQLSQTVSSPWVLAEPLFVFWLDIIYNERWLVNLFKCSCYFRLCVSSVQAQPAQPAQPAAHPHPHPPSHMGDILRRCLSQSWMRLRGRKAASHRVRVGPRLSTDVILQNVCSVLPSQFLVKEKKTCLFYCPYYKLLPVFYYQFFFFLSSYDSFHSNIQQMWWGGVGVFFFLTVTVLPRPPKATYTNWTSACYSFHWWGE